MQELGIEDQQLLSALDKAKADVDAALYDSFNTSAVMRILSDLVTESNSAEALSDQTVILLARWVTRMPGSIKLSLSCNSTSICQSLGTTADSAAGVI